MTTCIVDIPDELAIYLQDIAANRRITLSHVLEEMIIEDLKLSHEVEIAIEEAGVDVSDSDEPVLDAVRMLVSGIRYHKSVSDALKRNVA